MSTNDESIDVSALLVELKRLGVAELRERYESLTGERCGSGNREFTTLRPLAGALFVGMRVILEVGRHGGLVPADLVS